MEQGDPSLTIRTSIRPPVARARALGESAATFGELLRELRALAGLTQEELAERAGVSVRGLSDIERGLIAYPRRDTAQMIADALPLDDEAKMAFLASARRPVRGIAGPVAATPPGAGESPARNGRIPSPVMPLLGRARELAFARDLLLGGEKRLLTTTGPGGQRIEPGASSAHRSTRPSRYRPKPLITFAFCQVTSYRSPAGARIRLESHTVAGTVQALGCSAGGPARSPNAFAGRPRTRP